MSADTEEEEMDGAEQGHIEHEMYTRSPRRPPSWNKWKICASFTVVLLLVCIGDCFCNVFDYMFLYSS